MRDLRGTMDGQPRSARLKNKMAISLPTLSA
jgi:hypothetical protein